MSLATVLMLSQEPETADLYTWALNNAGFDVQRESSSGVEPDVLILHFHPLRDATSLVRDVRLATSGVPVIALTSCACRLDSDLFDRVLVFPVLPDQLVQSVASVLCGAANMTRAAVANHATPATRQPVALVTTDADRRR
jgi:DNA-binding response OmpR family regulator